MTYRLPHLASLQDIIEWADRIVSRSELPNVARRLVSQTNDSIIKLDMGGDEEVTFGGYDGKVLAGRGTPFVPEGASVWEFGTSTDFHTKANGDYQKRTTAPLDVVFSETTFVFVTPRRWVDADKWAAEKKADGVWKDVVVFDAADIYGAMENAPAVHIQFSEAVGKPANSVGGLEDWWNRYRAPVGGLLTPELVLAGRANEAAALLRTTGTAIVIAWCLGGSRSVRLDCGGRRDRLAHHGLALADVALERESRRLEHGPRAVVEERG